MDTFTVRTTDRDELIDVTGQVRKAVSDSGVQQGLACVFVPHTTAGVTINENADPDVVHDLLRDLDRLVPWKQNYYRHGEGNSPSHMKSSMIGCSITIPVEDGRPVLGTWQGIYFCEFDGPRTRRCSVQVLG